MDKEQRAIFTKEETDSIYIATTPIINDINRIINKEKIPEEHLITLKEEMQNTEGVVTFDIFGSILSSSDQVKTLGNIKHRENEKNKFAILKLKENTTMQEYVEKIKCISKGIQESIEKYRNSIEIPIYKAEYLDDGLNVFYINPEDALKFAEGKETNLYRIILKEKTNCIPLTNIMYYNNTNHTLPLGMNVSDGILIDTNKLDLKLKGKKQNYIINIKQDLPKPEALKINIFEYEIC